MKKNLLLLGIPLLLMGCSAQQAYDIDVRCPLKNLETMSQGGVQGFVCSGISGEGFSDFLIQCDAEAVQSIGDDWFCSTVDGKSVRIMTKESK